MEQDTRCSALLAEHHRRGPISPDPVWWQDFSNPGVTNVRLAGRFTLDGQENAKLHKEEYVITGATKLGTGDL